MRFPIKLGMTFFFIVKFLVRHLGLDPRSVHHFQNHEIPSQAENDGMFRHVALDATSITFRT